MKRGLEDTSSWQNGKTEEGKSWWLFSISELFMSFGVPEYSVR